MSTSLLYMLQCNANHFFSCIVYSFLNLIKNLLVYGFLACVSNYSRTLKQNLKDGSIGDRFVCNILVLAEHFSENTARNS